MKNRIIMILLLACAGCTHKEAVDLIIYNAKIYTVDSAFSTVEAFAVKEGKFVATGNTDYIRNHYESENETDAEGNSVYPGFIDAHCHFYNYGLSLQNADLRGTHSFEEVLLKLKDHYDTHHPAWLTGRGWDQNDWKIKEFPDNTAIDSMFPGLPVMITRIDGHAVLVSSEILKKANITSSTHVEGGEIVLKNGKPTGVLIDNAMNLVTTLQPAPSRDEQCNALLNAQKNCFAAGLTYVADAGLDKNIILLIDQMQKKDKIKMHVYAMLNPTVENYEQFMYKGVYCTDRLNVRSIKLYADGALGSRGACLLKPYTDDPQNYGLMVDARENLKDVCLRAYNYNYQVNIHAIGDSGVRTILEIFADVLTGPNDRRWRIEHAQVVAPEDFKLFSKYSIIPSVQPTHATSDMYWAGDRLGNRVKYAYAYKELLEQNGWIAFGTDFPIERIEPLLTFYAAVARKDLDGKPTSGWQMDNAVSRELALKAMTIWAARSFFDEARTGSIETGKLANFVILDQDIMQVALDEIPKTKILATYVNGEKVYSN
jgi:predicted amidohydrolase YtcJ